MQKEQLVEILPNDRAWRVDPTCDRSEITWGHFLLRQRETGIQLQPESLSIQMGNQVIEAEAIRKIGFGPKTYLVIAPVPGLLVSNNRLDPIVRRALMEQPKAKDPIGIFTLQKYFEGEFAMPHQSPLWYVEGMLHLLSEVVKGGVDKRQFAETLHAFDQICHLSAIPEAGS